MAKRCTLILLATAVWMCSPSPDVTELVPKTPGEVTYQLAWDLDGVSQHEDGWSVVSDLGITWRITRGYLVNFNLQLVPCEQASWLGIRPAWAGHSGDDIDPSAVGVSWAEAIVPLSPSTPPSQQASALYCKVHYLIARADSATHDLPGNVDLLGASLHLEGTWSRGGVDTPFTLRVTPATGVLPVLPEPIDAATDGAAIRVIRRPARWFDGLEPDADDDDGLGTALLNNLRLSVDIAAD